METALRSNMLLLCEYMVFKMRLQFDTSFECTVFFVAADTSFSGRWDPRRLRPEL